MQYERPEIRVISFDSSDIVTTSGMGDMTNKNTYTESVSYGSLEFKKD